MILLNALSKKQRRMKMKKTSKWVMMAVLLIGAMVWAINAQAQPRIDASPLKPVCAEFFYRLNRLGNVPVSATFAANSNWRKDWRSEGTYMRPTGAAFLWTNFHTGEIHCRGVVHDPPASLNGTRPQWGEFDVDGGLSQWDREYIGHYAQFVTRPYLDIAVMTREKVYYELWQALLMKHEIINSNGSVIRAGAALEAMGFSKTGFPKENLVRPIQQIGTELVVIFDHDQNIAKFPREVVHDFSGVEQLEEYGERRPFNYFIPIILTCLVVLFGLIISLARMSSRQGNGSR